MSKNPINKKIIAKTVQISQAIEGYGLANKSTLEEVKKLKEKYGIKVSTKR